MKTRRDPKGSAVLAIGTAVALCCIIATMELVRVSHQDPPPVVAVEAPPTSIQQALKTARVMDGERGLGSCAPVAVVGGRIAWVTCKHVIDDEVPSVALLRNGATLPVLGTAEHPSADAALLWTTSNPALPIVPLSLAEQAVIGTDILTAGYPRRIACLMMSRGLIGGVDEDGCQWTT